MIRHLFSEALTALKHYRTRSGLTMLSITWGVASLVLLLAYGEGFERALIKAFQQIGKDLVVVFPGQTSLQAGGERSGRHIQLELSDVKAIQEGVPTVEAISPEVRRYYPFNFNERVRSYSVAGVHAAFERIREAVVASGRFLSEDDVLQRRRVVVIGITSVKNSSADCRLWAASSKLTVFASRSLGCSRKKRRSRTTTPPTI